VRAPPPCQLQCRVRVGVGDERARGIEFVGERGAWKRARCVSSEESRGDVGGAQHDDVDE